MLPRRKPNELFIAIGLTAALWFLFSMAPILRAAFDLLVLLNAHESGHALPSNLGGRLSVPTPLGAAVSFWLERSYIFSAVLAGLLFLIFHAARKNRLKFIQWSAAFALACCPVFTFLLTDSAFEQLCIWSGLGGELILGALLGCAFFYPMPKRLDWEKSRFVVFPLAMILLMTATQRWTGSVGDLEKMPWGGLWQGFAIDGDLNRLRDEFSWSPDFILKSYLSTAVVCWAFLIWQAALYLIPGGTPDSEPRIESGRDLGHTEL